MAAHLQEHLAFLYRSEIEKELGVELPPPNEPLPEDIEVKLSRLVAEAAERLLQKDIAEVQQEENQKMAEDPVIQMQQKRLELEAADIERKAQTDQARIIANMQQAAMRHKSEKDRTETQAEIDAMRIGIDIAKSKAELASDEREISSKEAMEKAKLVADIGKALSEDEQALADAEHKVGMDKARLVADVGKSLAEDERKRNEGRE